MTQQGYECGVSASIPEDKVLRWRSFEAVARFLRGAYFPVLAAGLVAGLLILALCFPNPQGPADNGDFSRISALFVSGPTDMAESPEEGEQAFSRRFFNFYHQRWDLGREIRGAVRPSSSLLLYLPGWLVASATSAESFDLNCNTVFLVLLLSGVSFVLVRWLSSGLARLAAFSVMLLATDAGCSSYLNSFYQESGVFLFFILLVLLMCLWSERPTVACSVAAAVCGALLGITKRGIAPSVVVLFIPILLLLMLRRGLTREVRMGVVAPLVLAACTVLFPFDRHGAWYERSNCYNFIFSGVLPQLKPAERVAFLSELGIAEAYAADSGAIAYEPARNLEESALGRSLGKQLHRRAVSLLVFSYPQVALQLLVNTARTGGKYELPYIGYRSFSFSPRREPLDTIRVWSSIRSSALHGFSAIFLGLLVVSVAGVLSVRAGRGQTLVLGGLSIGCFLASLVQIPIAIFGDGLHELAKHLYFSNLTLDTSMVLGVVVLLAHFLPRRHDGLSGRVAGDP